MRRLWFFGVLAVTATLVGLAGLDSSGSAFAAIDDDIPGVPLAVGANVSGAVTAGDVADVYALTLTEGQEVHVRCDPGTVDGPRGIFHLLVPGATSVSDVGAYDEVAYTLRGGSPERHWADFDYIPARSGTYYFWVEWEAGALDYKLSVTRTSRATLTLAPDADDVPGVFAGSGSLTGVVSTLADPDDVYAVGMTAGRPVTIRLTPLAPYNNNSESLAYLNLLDPDAPSLAARFGHVIAGLVLAKNSKDSASRQIAEIQYVPTQTGVHYIWVEAGSVLYGHNFAYRLSISGSDDSPPPDLSDVADSPYATAIYELAKRGAVSGFLGGTFGPGQPVSRQQFAKMIVLTLGLDPLPAEQCPFGDVEAGWPYPRGYVATAAAEGITKGATTTPSDRRIFDPYAKITHQQLISMVVRAAGLVDPRAGYEPGFSSGQFYSSEHYLNARKAAYSGLLDGLQGMGPAYVFFAPSTRGECAQLLYNLLLLKE
jgi:hypothetical protein